MFSERRTAISSRMFAKFGDATISPSTATTKMRSRKRGTYCRMPRRSATFIYNQARREQIRVARWWGRRIEDPADKSARGQGNRMQLPHELSAYTADHADRKIHEGSRADRLEDFFDLL